jgi:hypothetical protein
MPKDEILSRLLEELQNKVNEVQEIYTTLQILKK